MNKVQNMFFWNFVAWIVLIILVGVGYKVYPYVVAGLKYLF